MKKQKMTTRQKLELMKKIEQRNAQRRKEFKVKELYAKGHITKEQMEEMLKK